MPSTIGTDSRPMSAHQSPGETRFEDWLDALATAR